MGKRTLDWRAEAAKTEGGFAESNVRSTTDRAPDVDAVEDAPLEPVTRFLAQTLARSWRYRIRKGVGYLTARSWRSPIKAYQIEALRAVKAKHDPDLSRLAAADIVAAIAPFVGTRAFDRVIAVPGGNSGDDCLAEWIAHDVSAMLSIPAQRPFVPRGMKRGSSHPAGNTKLTPLRFKEPVAGRVLLVDDVVTTGTHIVQAMTALRRDAEIVCAVGWIAGEQSDPD